jgi:hypothetical protein
VSYGTCLSRLLKKLSINCMLSNFEGRLFSNRYVRPVCLPILSPQMPWNQFEGHKATVSGWGLQTFKPIENGHGNYAQRLNKLELKVLSNHNCQKKWLAHIEEVGAPVIVTDSMLCAKRTNVSACYGDSGGKTNIRPYRDWKRTESIFPTAGNPLFLTLTIRSGIKIYGFGSEKGIFTWLEKTFLLFQSLYRPNIYLLFERRTYRVSHHLGSLRIGYNSAPESQHIKLKTKQLCK